jgi:DNA primase
MEINNRLLNLLNSVIGKPGTVSKNNELMYECPFCDTSKKKLQVNVTTQQWHCWVCDAKGRLIYTLLKKLRSAKSAFQELNQIYKNTSFRSKKDESFIVTLPEEFLPLTEFTDSIQFLHARNYLEKRNITDDDIIRYNIGYCTGGEYKDRIIIPSYDENGLLNYFVARSYYNKAFMKYKNPPAPKDTVIFDLYINWNMPVILCEGVFDAIAIKRNAIPLLGKTVQDALLQKMINRHVSEVTVILDADAKDTLIKVCDKLMRHNINVSTVMLDNGDPSDLGYKTMLFAIEKRTVMNEYDLIRQRIL